MSAGIEVALADCPALRWRLGSSLMTANLKPELQSSADDDADLLKRIRAGAGDEYAEIVRRYQSLVFGILHRYERDAQKVEDLAQETFVKAWRSLEQFDGRAPFKHWLSKIAVHVALDHIRKQKRTVSEVGFAELGEEALEWLRADDSREIETNAAREILEAALRELSPGDRLVITLQEIEGRSVKEIASLIGSSGVAVRVRAMRARRKLRAALESLGIRK